MENRFQVLIVDEDPIFCRFLADTLETHEIRADWTPDGLRGYQMSLTKRYDLFILDQHMPLALGADLARAIGADNPRAKIILISEFPQHAPTKITGIGSIPVLTKPFSPQQLLAEVKRELSEGQGSKRLWNLIRKLGYAWMPHASLNGDSKG